MAAVRIINISKKSPKKKTPKCYMWQAKQQLHKVNFCFKSRNNFAWALREA